MNKRTFWIATLVAGSATAAITSLPKWLPDGLAACYGAVGWVWLLAGGAAGVWLRQRLEGRRISARDGSITGLTIGLIEIVIGVPLSILAGNGAAAFWAGIGPGAMDPESAFWGLVILLVSYLAHPIFGALGSLLGTRLFKGPHAS